MAYTNMNVQVLLFGATANWIGSRKLDISIDENATVADVFERLTAQYSTLKDRKLKLAVNQQYATGEEIVFDGDELAIFTAVSGG
jgi:molybdopterin synthase sulfur carrier subunit